MAALCVEIYLGGFCEESNISRFGWMLFVRLFLIFFGAITLTWLINETSIVNSPASYFNVLSLCSIENITTAHIVSPTDCVARFRYEFLPPGINPALDVRLIAQERIQLLPAGSSLSIPECTSLIAMVSSTLLTGSTSCFRLESETFLGSFDCATVFPPESKMFNKECYTLFPPKAKNGIDPIAIGLASVGIGLFVCLVLSIFVVACAAREEDWY